MEITPTPDEDVPAYTYAVRVYTADPYGAMRVSNAEDL